MYVRIALTFLVLLLVVIAAELVRPPTMPPTPGPISPAESKLDQRLSAFKIENASIDEAVEMLRKQSGCPIHVDWAGVQIHQKDLKDQRVTVDLHDVPVWVVLEMIFNPYWSREGFHFNAVGDEVIVSLAGRFTPDKLKIRCYDIRDLLTDEYWGVKTPDQAEAILDARSEQIADLVSSFAQVENYQFAGGSRGDDGSLDGFAWAACVDGQLIIAQTSYGQRRFELALARVRGLKQRPK